MEHGHCADRSSDGEASHRKTLDEFQFRNIFLFKKRRINMDFIRLANIVRRYDDIDFLASEIEALEGTEEVESVDDLSEALEDELGYAGEGEADNG